MRLGIRAHDFGKLPLKDLAGKIAEKRFTSIQLALAKAIEDVNSETGSFNPGMAYYIKEIFSRHNIQIAVLGCYINPIHPDKEERKRQLARFKEHIRFARDFGCSIVATETGSFNADCSFHPDNQSEEAFKQITESVAELVEEAEKFGVFVCVEGVTCHTISTPQTMKRLLDTINSNNLQVLLDPVNMLSIENYMNQEQIINQCFDLYGDRIIAIHAKDFTIEDGRLKGIQIGKGLLNYELLLRQIKTRKPYVNVLIEESKPDTASESMDYLKDMYRNI